MGRKTNTYFDIRPVGTVYAGAVYIEIMCKQYLEYFEIFGWIINMTHHIRPIGALYG